MTLYDDPEVSYDSLAWTYDGTLAGTVVVTLGDIEYNCEADERGTKWAVSEIDGWDSPDVRSPNLARPGRDGLLFGEWFYGGRLLNLRGAFLARDCNEALIARTRLADNTDYVHEFATLEVDEEVARVVEVKRAGRLLIRQTHERYVEFEVALLARDPRKYAKVVSSQVFAAGAAHGMENAGNYPTPWIWTIDGPVTNPRLTNGTTFEFVEVDIVLLGGDQLVVSSDFRTVTLNGVDNRRSDVDTASTFFDLDPGVTVLTYTGTGAGPSTVELHSAWI